VAISAGQPGHSAQKANYRKRLQLASLRLIDGEYLFPPCRPGGSLFGLQESNPVDPDVAYRGQPSAYGQPNDPMVGAGSVA